MARSGVVGFVLVFFKVTSLRYWRNRQKAQGWKFRKQRVRWQRAHPGDRWGRVYGVGRHEEALGS